MDIIYPEKKQIDESVKYICEEALPQKKNIIIFLKDMTKNLGIKNIFFGMWDVILTTIFISVIIDIALVFTIISSAFTEEKILAIFFSISPIIFMLMFILMYIKEKSNDAYVVKMSCKYTVNYLIAYRMFTISLLSVVFNLTYIILLCNKFSIPILNALSVSFSSLFIFSIIMISVVSKCNSIFSTITVSILWLIINGGLTCTVLSVYGIILKSIPVLVWFLIFIVCAFVYVNKLTSFVNGGKQIHAYN